MFPRNINTPGWIKDFVMTDPSTPVAAIATLQEREDEVYVLLQTTRSVHASPIEAVSAALATLQTQYEAMNGIACERYHDLAILGARLEAAESLANEIRACWGMEWDAREAFGNTNYQCVLDKLAAFDATALKKIEVPTMTQHDAAIDALKKAGES